MLREVLALFTVEFPLGVGGLALALECYDGAIPLNGVDHDEARYL